MYFALVCPVKYLFCTYRAPDDRRQSERPCVEHAFEVCSRPLVHGRSGCVLSLGALYVVIICFCTLLANRGCLRYVVRLAPR